MASTLRLPRSIPEEQSITSAAIEAFVEAVEENKLELHSFMVMRHGHVVSEGWWSPYRPELPHMLFSLSKSFTSTAIGLAVSEGRLSVNDPVVSFFPDDASTAAKENMKDLQIRHLLTMSTGHTKNTSDRMRERKDGNWVKGFFELPLEVPPGTHFLYNSGASYMLSAIIQRVTGQTLLDYLRPRLFYPLAIEGADWDTCPQGVNTGGWGLSLKTEDIAKFGQLYLQKGIWNGNRILSQAWVEEATSRHIANQHPKNIDWRQGYGYQFWQCRHGAYRGDGAHGQFCIVMPEQDAVIVITSGVRNMQSVLDLVWEHLLPAMSVQALPRDASTYPSMKSRCSTLAFPPQQGNRSSITADKVSGKHFVLDKNDSPVAAVTFEFVQSGCLLTWHDDKGDERYIHCGIGKWIVGESTLFTKKPQRIAASGAWRDEYTFVMMLRDIEAPYCRTLVCTFDQGKLRIELSSNVNSGWKDGWTVQGN